MRRFYTALAWCLATTMAFAQAQPAGTTHRKAQPYAQTLSYTNTPQTQTVAQARLKPQAGYAPSASNGLITEQPAGTLHDKLIKTAPFMYPTRFPAADVSTNDAFSNGQVGKYVVDADGNLYIWQPFTGLNTLTWVKADKQANGRYSVKKQPVYVVDGVTYYTGRLKIDIDSKGQIWWYADKTRDDVEYELRNDSLILVDDGLTNGYGNTMLGLIDKNNNWYGYADWSTIMAVNPDKVNTPPASAERETYLMTYYDYDGDEHRQVVNVAHDGNDIYIGNFFKRLPEGWIKGTINGGTASFEAMQYLGCDYTHSYFRPITDQGQKRYYTQTLDFAYDADRGTLESDSAFHVNLGKMTTNVTQGYYEPSLKPYTETAGVPDTPEINTDYCSPYEVIDGVGIGVFAFTLPEYTTGGDYMNADKARYIVYLNGKPYTFTNAHYKYIDKGEEMTEVPFAFYEGYDFVIQGLTRIIYIYEPFTRASVQIVYEGNGERHVSDLATYDTDPTGITDATASQAGEATYYDLTGRRVNNPTRGLYIKSVKLSNGQTVNNKIALP